MDSQLPIRQPETVSATRNAESNTLREAGNVLYKSGRLQEACIKYRDAMKLAPSDDAPLRNLSAALYEMGNYRMCKLTASKAIKILEKQGGAEALAKVKILQQRLEKAAMHSSATPEDERNRRRRELLEKLPRYRASMFVTTEYFTVGHDLAISLFGDDGIFEQYSAKSETVSFFLGGVGDARNVLQTLSVLAELEQNSKIPRRRYHFTMNDIHKSALARDLVTFLLLDDLSELNETSDEAWMILNTIFFVFTSTMMPEYAYTQLNSTIERALDILTSGGQPLKWLYLHKKDIPRYIAALEFWKYNATKTTTNAKVIACVIKAMAISPDRGLNKQFGVDKPSQPEEELYYQTAALLPCQKILQKYDPVLLELMGPIDKHRPKAKARVIREHVQRHWHWNTTLMDQESCKEWYHDQMITQDPFDVGFSPFQFYKQFPYHEVSNKPRSPDRLFDHMVPFFADAAQAIKHLGGRLQAEFVLGDYTVIAERLHFGLYEDVSEECARPKDFPTIYDRIHLSNVPDYVGGHLSTFIFAMPIIRRNLAAILQANCLRNSSIFDDVEDYLSEYQFISDEASLIALTQVAVLMRGTPPLAMSDFTAYVWAPIPNSQHSFSNLLPRKRFTKWFYGLFFRLMLPFEQDLHRVNEVIVSPLNTTIIFHLVAHLHTLGYPAHWLSELLNNIIENKVVTTARPPRNHHTSPADVEREYAARNLCTGPFSYEIATQARLFEPLLPFSLASPKCPKENEISNYHFTIPSYDNFNPRTSNLMLFFFNMASFGDPSGPSYTTMQQATIHNFRALLDPSLGDEVDGSFKGPAFENLRSKALIVWSTFVWDEKARVASAWMPNELVDRMEAEMSWMVGMVRTDTWGAVVSRPAMVIDAVKKQESWGRYVGSWDAW